MKKSIVVGVVAVFLSGMAAQANVNWEFNTLGDLEGWDITPFASNSLPDGIEVTNAVSGSEIVLTAPTMLAGDPGVLNLSTNSAAGEYWNTLEIRARQLDGVGGSPVPWDSGAGTVVVLNSAVISYTVGGSGWDTTTEANEWIVTTLSLPTVGTNDITYLRVDPVPGAGESFEIDYIRLTTSATPPPVPVLGFEFNTLGDTEGWVSDQIAELWVANAVSGSDVVLTASDITGDDSKVIMADPILLPPGKYWKYVELRVRLLDGNGGSPIAWEPVGTLFYPNHVITSKTIGGDGWETTSGADEWIVTRYDMEYLEANPITYLRFDFTSNGTRNFEVDYIRFATRDTPALPPAPEKLIKGWEFNTIGDTEDFTDNGHISGLKVDNAINGAEIVLTSADITDGDPQLLYNAGAAGALAISPSGPWVGIEIRIRHLDGNPGDPGVASLPWAAGHLVYINPGLPGSKILGDGDILSVTNEADNWLTAVYDISSLGSLDFITLRLDPLSGTDNNFEVDYIRIYSEGSNYDAWSQVVYELAGNDALMEADPDLDTYNNLYEYAFGGDPTNPAEYGFVESGTVNDGGIDYFEYVHARRTGFNTGLAYDLQLKDDLVTGSWISIGDTAVVGAEQVSDDYEAVTNRIEAVDSKKFLNLEVTGE